MKLCNTWINGRFTDRYREKIEELQINNEEDGYIWYTEKPGWNDHWPPLNNTRLKKRRKQNGYEHEEVNLMMSALANVFRLSLHQLTEWPFIHFRKLIS